ncbi:uncharacterized protein LOC143838184 isoform X1 [Paroedura picta]|uniref:uncharacterized protein LOC143838184 isoform X1 n=1 Tax=Paroedura picta TaxID=143630 RepID=UPI00405793E9
MQQLLCGEGDSSDKQKAREEGQNAELQKKVHERCALYSQSPLKGTGTRHYRLRSCEGTTRWKLEASPSPLQCSRAQWNAF